MVERPHILLIEDDAEIRGLLADFLARNGCRVDCGDGAAALDRHLAHFGPPDLIVLDIMLPGEDGLSICRRLRTASRVPIILLTARTEDIDRIIGLEMGADDYIAKPFNPRELLARVRAVLRRAEPIAPSPGRRLGIGDVVIDLERRGAARGDIDLELTAAEYDLLACFLERPGRVLSRDQLMDWTRGRRAEAFDRTIDVQVSRLRRKLERDGEMLIKTVRNHGYVLTVTPANVPEEG